MSDDTTDYAEAWRAAAPEHRYVYEMHTPMIVLHGVALGAFWITFAVIVAKNGLSGPNLWVGIGFLVVTLWSAAILLRWKHFVRVSGVVCEDDRLVWRHGNKAMAAPWRDLDFDGIGLLSVDPKRDSYERFLTVGGERLYLFRPYVRLRTMEIFFADLLLHLKAHGRLPTKADKRGGPGSPPQGGADKAAR